MNYHQMSIYERIKHLRKNELKMTQEDFANQLGISRSNIGNIEVGRINVTERVIQDICSKFNINEIWLRNGDGDVFVKNKKSILEELVSSMDLTEREAAVIQAFMELSHEGREAVINFAENIAKTVNKKDVHIDFDSVVKRDILETEKKINSLQQTKSNT